MAYQTLKVTLSSEGVLELVLSRPEVRNAFNQLMIQELASIFTHDVLEPSVKVVLLRGAGPVFCAGGDLNWMKQSVHLDYAQNLEQTMELTRMFSTLNECPKPLIGAVHGAALGGGVGLVSVCDAVIAVQGTEFSLSEVRLGIVPACIGPFVVSKIGVSHARKLFVTAERISAQRAYEIGLIHEVVPDQAGLDQALARMTGALLQCGPKAIAAAKKLVLDLGWHERRQALPDPLAYVSEVLAGLRTSPEGQEGLSAFLEKRKPHFDAL